MVAGGRFELTTFGLWAHTRAYGPLILCDLILFLELGVLSQIFPSFFSLALKVHGFAQPEKILHSFDFRGGVSSTPILSPRSFLSHFRLMGRAEKTLLTGTSQNAKIIP
jgi:hypothetical protein